MSKQVENYDSKKIRAAGEKLLPYSLEQAGEIGERFAADMKKQFGDRPYKGKGIGYKPLDG